MQKYTRSPSNLEDCTPAQLRAILPDEGCEESSSCLECPIEMCRFDNPAWYQRLLKEREDREILAAYHTSPLRVNTKRCAAVARALHIQPRTVFRALERERCRQLAR